MKLRELTLGSLASINGAAYTRGSAAQYDAWSALLESNEQSVGWNWQGMFGYMKKVRSDLLYLLPRELSV